MLKLANDQAEECIDSEKGDYFQLNQNCLKNEVNYGAKEMLAYSLGNGFLLTFAFAGTLGLILKMCIVGIKAADWVEECYKGHGLFGQSDENAIALTSTPQQSGYGSFI